MNLAPDNNPFPRLEPLTRPEDVAAVLAAGRADNDGVCFPSHAVVRGGEVVGAVSLGVVPLVMLWNHSQKVGPRDSLHLKRVYDAMMLARGTPAYVIACNQRSPYHAHMERLGFKSIWATHLYEGGSLQLAKG